MRIPRRKIIEASYKTKIYLATCYTYGDGKGLYAKFIAWLRYRRVTRMTGKLLTMGYNVFSPITHSHLLPKYIPERLNTHSLWLGLDLQWVDACDELFVYMQPGWKESYGVDIEIRYANRTGKPVRYVNMKGHIY